MHERVAALKKREGPVPKTPTGVMKSLLTQCIDKTINDAVHSAKKRAALEQIAPRREGKKAFPEKFEIYTPPKRAELDWLPKGGSADDRASQKPQKSFRKMYRAGATELDPENPFNAKSSSATASKRRHSARKPFNVLEAITQGRNTSHPKLLAFEPRPTKASNPATPRPET